MRFLLDESVDSRLASFLTNQGHNTTIIAHDYPHALSDREVLAIARREKRIIVTNDRDFGELVFHQRLRHSGVIYFRLNTNRLERIQERLQYVLTSYSDRLDEFIVVTDWRVRSRQSGRR